MITREDLFVNIENRLAFVDVKSDIEITDPFVSTCGRFEVDPVEAYDVDVETAIHMAQANGSLAVED